MVSRRLGKLCRGCNDVVESGHEELSFRHQKYALPVCLQDLPRRRLEPSESSSVQDGGLGGLANFVQVGMRESGDSRNLRLGRLRCGRQRHQRKKCSVRFLRFLHEFRSPDKFRFLFFFLDVFALVLLSGCIVFVVFGSRMNSYSSSCNASWHGTTVLCVHAGEETVMAADGQVSFGSTIVKMKSRKLRRLSSGRALAGFAGATADAFTLFERLEAKLEQHPGQLERACVELARDWRMDRYLRRLEAMLAVANSSVALLVSGNGDVLGPEDGLLGIGSGGPYALAAARALHMAKCFSPEEIARRSLQIAADICVYTNHEITIERLHEDDCAMKGASK